MVKFMNQAGAMVVVLLCVPALPGQEKKKGQPADHAQVARTFVQLLDRGDFDKATADFDAIMLKVLPSDKLKKNLGRSSCGRGSVQEDTGRAERN